MVSDCNNNISYFWVEFRNELSCVRFLLKSASPFPPSSFPLFMFFPQMYEIGLCWILRGKENHGSGPALRSLARIPAESLGYATPLVSPLPEAAGQRITGQSKQLLLALEARDQETGCGCCWITWRAITSAGADGRQGARKEPAGMCEGCASLVFIRVRVRVDACPFQPCNLQGRVWETEWWAHDNISPCVFSIQLCVMWSWWLYRNHYTHKALLPINLTNCLLHPFMLLSLTISGNNTFPSASLCEKLLSFIFKPLLDNFIVMRHTEQSLLIHFLPVTPDSLCSQGIVFDKAVF